MKLANTIKVAGVSAIMSLSVGCASVTGDGPSLSSQDWEDMSCSEIEMSLTEFKKAADGGQAGMFSGLIALVSPSAAETQQQAENQAEQVYQQAKVSAEPVMETKGCDTTML